MVNGIDEFIEADVQELRQTAKSPLEIVEGPLMDAMKEVGKRFDNGTMYLPQIILSAKIMKKAASILEPYMEKKIDADVNNSFLSKIILATVKGDVHDIGKNIVGLVLACNGYQVIDLGVMVPAEQIIDTAVKEQAAIIGLSGLISPSLDEMANVAREMEKRGMKIPLLIGGAAASLVHTSLRIAPEYAGPVVYVPNAGKAAETAYALLSAAERPRFLHDIENSYREAAARHESIQSRVEIIPLAQARANRIPPPESPAPAPKTAGIIELNDYPLERVIPYINQGKVNITLLEHIKLRGVAGIFPAVADGDDIVIDNSRRFCFLRNQHKKTAGAYNPCLADFLASNDWLGLFALSAGYDMDTATGEYDSILLANLANALTEAFIEEVHQRIRREWWGYAPGESAAGGIRPAFGYPSCPDHEDKRTVFALLEAEKRCGLELTDTAMIIPAASVCGMIFANPAAHYFGVGTMGEDQWEDWARRKGIAVAEARKRLASI